MADCIQQTYIKEPDRGYASGAIFLFKRLNKLKSNNELQKFCFVPAMELFNGEGRYAFFFNLSEAGAVCIAPRINLGQFILIFNHFRGALK